MSNTEQLNIGQAWPDQVTLLEARVGVAQDLQVCLNEPKLLMLGHALA
jgi:hypothetical protein